jgi:hypothetical protein
VVQVTGGSRIPVGVLSYLHHINKEMDAGETTPHSPAAVRNAATRDGSGLSL